MYLGSCIEVLDNDSFRDTYARDATELAQIVEAGEQVDFNDFVRRSNIKDLKLLELLEKNREKYFFFIHEDSGLAWFYDPKRDVEHFFELVASSSVPEIVLTASEILRHLVHISTPDRVSKASGCVPTLVGFDARTGIATFHTRCVNGVGVWEQNVGLTTIRGTWHDLLELVYLSSPPPPVLTLDQFLSDFEESGLDFSQLSVKVSCDCPDFSYQGYSYLLHQMGLGFTPSPGANRAPQMRNPENAAGLCKHLIAVAENFFL